jgi:hypothetical protein
MPVLGLEAVHDVAKHVVDADAKRFGHLLRRPAWR